MSPVMSHSSRDTIPGTMRIWTIRMSGWKTHGTKNPWGNPPLQNEAVPSSDMERGHQNTMNNGPLTLMIVHLGMCTFAGGIPCQSVPVQLMGKPETLRAPAGLSSSVSDHQTIQGCPRPQKWKEDSLFMMSRTDVCFYFACCFNDKLERNVMSGICRILLPVPRRCSCL